MDPISPSDLKTILHSKRANLYYLEHCRVVVNGGRVEYITEQSNKLLYWNIPIANTTSVILGPGTSVTQAAMREFARAGVIVGFCGGGGTPLYSALEIESPQDVDVAWIRPQSEYRPTEYLQGWAKLWFDEQERLNAAKTLQISRIEYTEKIWTTSKFLKDNSFIVSVNEVNALTTTMREMIATAPDTTSLLTAEARQTKELYRLAANAVKYGEFTRSKRGNSIDLANRFLDHGNYLAYGLAASALWVLGLPHGFAVLHGKTRRGGLVFDIADLVKDALVLPTAFISAEKGDTERDFRETCIGEFARTEALDHMIEVIKKILKKEDDNTEI